MFVVRPILRHFSLWLLLAPLFLVEAYALNQLFQVLALHDPARIQRVTASIVEQRESTRGTEIRYHFAVPGVAEPYSATSMNVVGRIDIWVPISAEAAQSSAQARQIEVIYLPEDPWVNQPVGRAGNLAQEQFCTWGIFVIIDLLWLAETALIVRNYGRALAAAERREALRVRFWRAGIIGNW